MAYDLLIKNGRVIDGSGAPGFHGDVAVANGKIVGVGKFNESATRTINADGLVVSPGWIDNHTHYDAQALYDPLCSSSAQNGHTSVVVGNCGLAASPSRKDDPDFIRRMFSGMERIPIEVLRHGVDVSWGPVSGYLSALAANRGINVAALIGHSAVRHYVMGDDCHERAGNPEEIAEMREVVREGMMAGAIGLSFEMNARHHVLGGPVIPGAMASHEERLALADVLGELGVGTIQKGLITDTVLEDFYEPIRFAMEVSERTGRPCSFNFIAQKEADPGRWKELLQRAEDAYHEGYRIYPMCLSVPAGQHFTFGHPDQVFTGTAIEDLFGGLPTWDAVLGESQDQRMGGFRNPETRDKLRQEAASRPWDRVVVFMTELEGNRSLCGKRISRIAEEQGKDVVDCFLDLNLDDNLDTIFTFIQTNTDDAAVMTIMNSVNTTIGVSDGGAGPHVNDRQGYPANLLGYYVREKEAMSLEKAIYKLTSMSAMVFGITDRGVIREGLAADFTIFDPETIAPMPPEPAYDLPGTGGMRVKQLAKGINYVVVNGEVMMENAEHTGALPGQVLTNGLYGNNH